MVFISGQYFCQHEVTDGGGIETETGQGDLGRDGSINFKEDPLYSLGFLQFPWDYVNSDNWYVGWQLSSSLLLLSFPSPSHGNIIFHNFH